MKRLLPALLIAVLFLVACGGPTVQKGDFVQVIYAGAYQNGTLFDTNDPTLQDSFPAPITHFKPLTVHVGAGGVVPGFDNSLVGMKQGEKKEFVIKARDAYGPIDAARLVSIPKQLTFQKEMVMRRMIVTPKDEFLTGAKLANATVGMVFETKNFWYNITDFNSTHLSLYLLNATKDPIQLEKLAWNSSLIRTSSSALVYEHNVRSGDIYTTEAGPYLASLNSTHIILDTAFVVGKQYQTPRGPARVTGETDDSIKLDFNHPLAGKDLTFNITIDLIQK